MPTGGRRPELDGLRGIAILLVLVGHSDQRLAPLASVGVTLFFALSGYLITGLLLTEWEQSGFLRLGRFYARRFTRLAPPLFVMVAVMGTLLGGGWGLLAPVTWLTNYARLAGLDTGWFDHTWSLAVEEQFYLVWPVVLLLLLRLRRPAWALLGILVVLTGWRLVLTTTGHALYGYYALETAGTAVLGGCLMAMSKRLPTRHQVAIALLWAVGVLALLAPITETWWLVGPIVVCPMAAVVVGAAGRMPWLAWHPLAFCGVASYSLYLWHEPVSWLVRGELSPTGVLAGAAVGLLAHRLVEVPVMRWRSHGVVSQGNRRHSAVGAGASARAGFSRSCSRARQAISGRSTAAHASRPAIAPMTTPAGSLPTSQDTGTCQRYRE